ncbi:unnamed protein product [Heligmosomoides polygyrus]|uniref:HTH_48 domain-containing protein n=1 Tax=Heligmosomoides polygyrus TaxID=6339 RepID=A0A183GFV8_HELPZ|nr:unnamed protein product [Heligmosomoides polygyrus]
MFHDFKLRRSVSEATQNIKMAWGEDSANERIVRRWYQKFRVGDVDLEDKDRSGRPAKCDDGRLKERVEADSRETVREMGRELQDGKFDSVGKTAHWGVLAGCAINIMVKIRNVSFESPLTPERS